MSTKRQVGAILLFVLLAGCISTGPQCRSPYIEYKKGNCCLDVDNNGICDNDEKPSTTTTTIPPKLSKFEIDSRCDSVLQELGLSIRNTYTEKIVVDEITINVPRRGMPSGRTVYPGLELNPNSTESYTLRIPCDVGGILQVEVAYIDSQGSHRELGNYELG